MPERAVIPGCDLEGEILENARKKKKESDAKYTQAYVAGLVGLDQGIWTQWRRGTTRIRDRHWLVFAKELEFDPFETRPELLETGQLAAGISGLKEHPEHTESILLVQEGPTSGTYDGADDIDRVDVKSALLGLLEVAKEGRITPEDETILRAIAGRYHGLD
jgi:hypothetical protein